MDKVNLEQKFAAFTDYFNPRIVGELNGQHVKLVKAKGDFVWHHHDHEDELFLVVKGRFRMEFRDREVWVEEGEFLVVPRGVEHRPMADLMLSGAPHDSQASESLTTFQGSTLSAPLAPESVSATAVPLWTKV